MEGFLKNRRLGGRGGGGCGVLLQKRLENEKKKRWGKNGKEKGTWADTGYLSSKTPVWGLPAGGPPLGVHLSREDAKKGGCGKENLETRLRGQSEQKNAQIPCGFRHRKIKKRALVWHRTGERGKFNLVGERRRRRKRGGIGGENWRGNGEKQSKFNDGLI